MLHIIFLTVIDGLDVWNDGKEGSRLCCKETRGNTLEEVFEVHSS